MLQATAIISSILAIIYLKLTLNIVKLRRSHLVRLGHGNIELLENAIRIHGNFSEYTPFFLILLAIFELNGGYQWLVLLLGFMFVIGRLLHVKGINQHSEHLKKRVLGMLLTFYLILFLAVANVVLVVLQQFL